MTVLTLTYPEILACVFAALFMTTFITLLGVRRQLHEQDGLLRRLSELTRADAVTPCQSDEAENDDSERFASELSALKETVKQLRSNRRDVAPIPESPAIAEAVALVRQGVGVDAIVERFEMSRGEAELMVKLHRKGEIREQV